MSTRSRIALAVAAVWSVGLLVAAVTVPVYSGVTSTSTSEGTTPLVATSATLVEENGRGALLPVGLPLLFTAATAGLLVARSRHRWAGAVAWVPVALCAALAVLGILTIGVFIAPVAVALAVAAASPPAVSPPAAVPGWERG